MYKFNHWITCPDPKPQARLRLFCLPFAGGGASIFQSWGKLFGNDIEVCPVQLPARENRYSEAAFKSAQTLGEVLASHLQFYIKKPFSIYGHSMGALLAFELTRALQNMGAEMPQHLILAAHRAAHLPRNRQELFRLPDTLFIKNLAKLGGFPEEVLSSPELMEFFMPTLRSDFELCETYQFIESKPLSCPIQILSGRHDLAANPEAMEPWRFHSTEKSTTHIFDAGHFFIKSHKNELIHKLQTILS